MNDILKDIMNERFTWREYWLFGVLAPAALVLLAVIASAL